MNKNLSESQRTRRLIRARAQQCYRNAFRVVSAIPEYADAAYVEGMAVLPGGLPIEHGWVEKDGEVVDPTLTEDGITYFPGLRFQGQQGLAEAMAIPKPDYTEEDLPIFYRLGWGGGDSPAFNQARADALEFCQQFVKQSA